MRNNESLYFDMWRKKDFKELLMVYTQTANCFKTKSEMIVGFEEMLDKYIDGGSKKYTGTKKQWSSAYTLGRELGIFRNSIGESYELSKLAKDFLESKILGSEYLLNYLLNLNQLIDGKITHPLYEILTYIQTNEGNITKSNALHIPVFKLANKSVANQRQLVNILFHRMVEAGIIIATLQKDEFRLSDRYSLKDLLRNCVKSNKTPQEFLEMTQAGYADMLSVPNPLIPVYHQGRDIKL